MMDERSGSSTRRIQQDDLGDPGFAFLDTAAFPSDGTAHPVTTPLRSLLTPAVWPWVRSATSTKTRS